MGSRVRIGMPTQLGDSCVNIDAMCDAMIATQVEHGKTPTMEVAYRDEVTGKKFRRFQERSKEEEEYYQSAVAHNHRQTPYALVGLEPKVVDKPKGPQVLSRFKTGTFEVIIDDDDDGLYICEYCNKLGYRQKFIQAICDSCDDCTECSQRLHDECSGCSYSRHRTGVCYSQQLSESELLTADDIEKFKDVESNNVSDTRKSWKHFTVDR